MVDFDQDWKFLTFVCCCLLSCCCTAVIDEESRRVDHEMGGIHLRDGLGARWPWRPDVNLLGWMTRARREKRLTRGSLCSNPGVFCRHSRNIACRIYCAVYIP